MADRPDFSKMSVGDLRALAESLSVENTAKMKKGELIASIEMKATVVAADSSSTVNAESSDAGKEAVKNVVPTESGNAGDA